MKERVLPLEFSSQTQLHSCVSGLSHFVAFGSSWIVLNHSLLFLVQFLIPDHLGGQNITKPHCFISELLKWNLQESRTAARASEMVDLVPGEKREKLQKVYKNIRLPKKTTRKRRPFLYESSNETLSTSADLFIREVFLPLMHGSIETSLWKMEEIGEWWMTSVEDGDGGQESYPHIPWWSASPPRETLNYTHSPRRNF